MSLIVRESDQGSKVNKYEENIPYDQKLGPMVNLPLNPYSVQATRNGGRSI